MPADRIVQTMCPMNCHPTLCGMTVTVSADQSVQIKGDPENPDSRGFLCMRGNAAHEIVGNPRRLLSAQTRARRGTAAWEDTTWDAALDRIAQEMTTAGREAVAIWPGHGNAVNDYGFGLKRGQLERFANLYGCQYWNPAMICWGLGGFGLGLTGAIETSTKEDMGAHSELIILWGANTVSQANTIKHVEAAKRRGAHIVVIDVRRTELSALAHEVILLRPGSDTALALAMMQVIVTEGLQDDAFIAAYTVGFDALRSHLQDKTPDWAAVRTGVAAERIADLARRYATTAPAMIVIGGSSLHKGDNTWMAARAISCLPGLTGNFGKPGAGIGPRHGARSHGAGFADITASDRRLPGDYVPNQMEAIIDAMEQGCIKVLLVLGSNFLSSFPDTDRVRAALGKVDLIVAYDIFSNQTIREVADIVLPGTIWLEEIGAKATNTHVYLSDQALTPRDQTRPLYELYKGLADRLGVADVYPWADQVEAMNAVLDHPATGHVTVDKLRANGGRAALRISHVAYPTLEFDTPSGKLEFLSDKAIKLGVPPLPEAAEPDTDAGLVLAQGRTFAHFHSFYDHARALPSLAAREEEPQIWIAPDDAAARDIVDGDRIELRRGQAAFQARAKVTPRMPAGAVWARDGWPGFNALTDGSAVLPDTALHGFPFSVGQSGFGARVELVKA
ncbi:molybdopterin-containing oxidoreductase family protein [Aestuariivita boseongensis]|uniref:molybdopterin-containing oxidoreductase family protein n=1 Tax=Aestuariivita boseongensis TaxID=1470562 RepID=UPI0006813FEF|nr:molybdopterin-dependent oxidoreductase [Aestuariivita boseongensis]